MNGNNEQWVEKVHPLSRDATAEDPFELMAEPVAGDPQVMLACMLEEFLWLGWNADDLFALFHHPGYPVLVQLREHFGDAMIRNEIDNLLARTGVLQFRETIAADDEPEPELIQITLPARSH